MKFFCFSLTEQTLSLIDEFALNRTDFIRSIVISDVCAAPKRLANGTKHKIVVRLSDVDNQRICDIASELKISKSMVVKLAANWRYAELMQTKFATLDEVHIDKNHPEVHK